MLANLNLNQELNAFATELIEAGHNGIKAELVIEDGRHDFHFVADMDTPVGVLIALLAYGQFDGGRRDLLEYAKQLLSFCDRATPGGDVA